MIPIVALLAAVAILRCAADGIVTTSLLLPSLVFADQSAPQPTFVGQVNAAASATYYILDYYARGANTTSIYNGGGYIFSESSVCTQYVVTE